MTSLLLTGLAAMLVGLGGRRLAHARWVVRAPGLGLFVWQMLCTATVVTVMLVSLTAMLHWDDDHSLVCQAWRVCLDALYGQHGRVAQLIALFGATLLGVVAARLAHASCRVVGVDVAQGRRLRAGLRLVGRRIPGLGVTVVPSAEPAAYLVPGGQHEVVITDAVLERLTPDEVHAVLAHEQAHASGRHYWMLRCVRLLHRAFPRISLFRFAHAQVERLVELRADEVAARSRGRIPLARALVTMAELRADHSAATGVDCAGIGRLTVLSVNGADTAERLHCLLEPPSPLPAAATRTMASLAVLLPLVPVALIAAYHLLSR